MQDKLHTFAVEEQIEFTESYKRNVKLDVVDPTGSDVHTFGRRSRAQVEASGDITDDKDENEEELTREAV